MAGGEGLDMTHGKDNTLRAWLVVCGMVAFFIGLLWMAAR